MFWALKKSGENSLLAALLLKTVKRMLYLGYVLFRNTLRSDL